MGKTREQYLTEAKELGLTTEGLSFNELRSAVKAAKEAEAVKDVSTVSKDDYSGQGGPDFEPELEESPNPTQLRQEAATKKREAGTRKAKKEAKAKAAKEEQEKAKAEKNSKRTKKDNRPSFTDDRGLVFKFKKTAPKSLNIDGRSRKISELIKDKEVMLELVYGNSNHIEQIY
ncbi:MAG: hypothetical protein WBG90_05050 [Saonia sp.]